jgi:nucleoside-diphosphate-sugar epimerase
VARYKALVAGGLGVIGRNLIDHLAQLSEWEIVGVSRRRPDFQGRAQFVSVDLLDPADTQAKLSHLTDVTHIFYCAFQPAATWAAHNAPNKAMLVNVVEAIEAVAPTLQHVHLVEGNKIYGSHLGPFKTPAKESDPPHMLPNFYFDQEQWLRRQQQGKRWTWSATRPHTVCGFALGNPMNITTVIAVYATISRELGLPLRFPGKPGAFEAIYQVTDSELLAKAMLWCGTAPTAENEVFNITNTDFFRWKNVWPQFARHFGMEVGPVQTIPLTQFMADKEPLWNGIVEKYGLQAIPYGDVAAWPFADYVFGCDWDVMTDTLKIRQAGFHECVRSDEMFLRMFQQFRDMRVIP